MPLLLWTLIFSAIFGAEKPAHAAFGTKDGGGGKGVLCGSQLRTLDIYEAEEIHHFARGKRYPTGDANFLAFGQQIMQDLFPVELNELLRAFFLDGMQGTMQDHMQAIPRGQRLAISEDATLPRLPAGCSFVQIALISDEENLVRIDAEYWEMLDAYNQAALLLHEGIYRYVRANGGVTSSDETRWLVGLNMSAQPHGPIFRPVWQAPRMLLCKTAERPASPAYELYGVEENGGITFHFRRFAGVDALSPTRIFLPGATLDGLKSNPGGRFTSPLEKTLPSTHVTAELGFAPLPEGEISDGFGSFDFSLRIRAKDDAAFSQGYCKIMGRGEYRL